MSRSRRNTPIIGNCSTDSDDWHKRTSNRRHRHAIRQHLQTYLDCADLPHQHQHYNPWDGAKDGKHWIGDLPGEVIDRLMRK